MKQTIAIFVGFFFLLLSITGFSQQSIDSEEAITVNDTSLDELVSCWLSQTTFKPISVIVEKRLCKHDIKAQYVWVIVKKALIWGLRHHTDTIVKRLPRKWQTPVSKYANKVANLIETLEEWKEGACIIGLTGMGIPPSDSIMICQAISYLL